MIELPSDFTHHHSGYGIGFDSGGSFSLSDGTGFDKNVIIFGADMSLSLHVDNRKQDILILGKGPTQGLDDTTLTAEEEYSIKSTEKHKKLCLSLYYNGVKPFMFVNGAEIYKFKAKNCEINAAPLYLGNVSKYFSFDNMKKLDYTDMSMIFQSIMTVLMLLILNINV